MKITFKKLGINGEGIGYINRMPVFCDGVLPGETAEIEITEQKKNYYRAELKKLYRKSEHRVQTDYEYYIEEGCPLMILDHPAQLEYKKQLLEEALYKYSHTRRHFVRDVNPSEDIYGYRSQCKLPVQLSRNHIVTGMYVPGSNHFHPIPHSVIQDADLEKARRLILRAVDHSHLHEYQEQQGKGLRYLVIRSIQGKIQCTLVTGKDKIHKELVEEIMAIDGMQGLFQSINTDRKTVQIFGSSVHKLAGEDTLPVTMNGITLQLSPQSFFQLNVKQAEKMYQMAISKIDKCDTLVEAYCGVGAMSLMAHKKAKHIIGIESIQDAVDNANANASTNKIRNAKFICADAADGLKKIALERMVDTLLVDPPRSGMDDKMLEAIQLTLPKKIIYISCNPATLSKNLNVLKHNYHVVTILPYDLFPHTPHVECICVLERDNYAPGQKH